MTASAEPSLSARQVIDLRDLGGDEFRSVHQQDNYAGAVFGGQYLAQALVAARRTVPDWPIHHCSALFLQAGKAAHPLDFSVTRTRDGKQFAARRVIVSQGGAPMFDLLCSFQACRDGVRHQLELGSVELPERLDNLAIFAGKNRHQLDPRMADLYQRPFPVELRLTEPERLLTREGRGAEQDFWFRMSSASEVEDQGDHQCLLAFMSDYWFAGVAGALHAPTGSASFFASLNHSMWFHAPARADQWLYYQTESPWAGAGRGLARGFIYNEAGELVASVVQEVAMGFD
ncbi:acyl-CoA thioesterase [Sphingomonas tabacisoli]|uniref:Acyl-CoA thioesterase n=1 Tax=Sphingomonas tabacisoli TaxID=2249466 RepID=A0ABW4I457_9SPHN